MKKIQLSALALLILFILPMAINVVNATTITPVLRYTYTGDFVATDATFPNQQYFGVNSTGNIDLYYVRADASQNIIYKMTGGSATALFTGSWVANDYDEIYAITPYQSKILCMGFRYQDASTDYVYLRARLVDMASGSSVQTATDGGTVCSPVWSGFGLKSEIIISNNGNAYCLCRIQNVYYIFKYVISTNTVSKISISIDNTDSGNYGFPFFIAGTDNIGFVVYSTTNYCYTIIVNTSTDAITKITHSIGDINIDDTYPIRIIENSLVQNEAGQINGRLTLMGAPATGNGMSFLNFYVVSGSWGWEKKQSSPIGYDYACRGNTWAYHDGSDTVCISWYKDAYTTKQLWTAVIDYSTSGIISSISFTIDPATTEYPITTQTVWAYESVFWNTAFNWTNYWYYEHGYYPQTTGNYRGEMYAYGGTFTAFYTITGTATETAEQPSGFYEIGGLDIQNTYNISANNIYYIRQAFNGNITLRSISVLINETFVNATCNHTFAFVIWDNNDLAYLHNITTSVNGTAIYTDNIDVNVDISTVRAGVVSWGNNLLGDPLGVGASANNVDTYYKSFSGVASDLNTTNWVYEGDLLSSRLAISVGWESNYVPPQYDEGGGAGTISIVNGTIVINTDVNGSISGNTFTDQTTPIGTSVLNAFNSWGYGATAGGYILWVCFLLGITMLMSKVGVGGGASVLTGFLGSAFICYGLGLVGATIIILSVLVVIVLASKEIVGLVRGG